MSMMTFLIPIEIYPQQLDGGRKRKYKKRKIMRRKTRKTRKKYGGDSDIISSPKQFKKYLEKHDRRIYLIKQTIDGPPKYFIAAFGKWDGNGNKADKITFILPGDENAYAAEFAWNDFIEQQPHGLGPKTKLMYLNEGPIPSNEIEIRFALLQNRYSPIDIHPEQQGGRKRKYKKTTRRKTRKYKRKRKKYRKSHKKIRTKAGSNDPSYFPVDPCINSIHPARCRCDEANRRCLNNLPLDHRQSDRDNCGELWQQCRLQINNN